MTVTLGTTRRGRSVRLSDEERSRHIHVVGASGTGKSKLLETMIRQDILLGRRGLCVVDPHGTLVDAVVQWCAALRVEDRGRRVHLLDLTDSAWATGFNPLKVRSNEALTARVDAMVSTCAEVWGGEDINQTPLLTTSLQLVFYALAANDLTLVESTELTSSLDRRTLARRLTHGLPDAIYRSYWDEMSALPRRDFEERFSSTRRRLLRFLGAPQLRRTLGQQKAVIDFRAVMDGGDIVLVNLARRGAVSDENARLLGALVLSELRLAAVTRDAATARARPFTLYVDECYDYLTGDVERMLDETRKFGLHVVLAHQRLGQLAARSQAIESGVMSGGQTKIVFGGRSDEEAGVMAREVFRSTFNLERPKRSLDKPVVTGEVPFWLDSESSTESQSRTWGETTSSSSGRTESTHESLSEGFDQSGRPLGYGLAAGSGSSKTTSDGRSSSYGGSAGSATTFGRSQTLKPVRVTMPTAVHSLDEELHLKIVALRELPNQAAIVKRRGHPPVRFRPTTVPPALATTAHAAQFISAARHASPYVSESAHADEEIESRMADLRADDRRRDDGSGTETPFWS